MYSTVTCTVLLHAQHCYMYSTVTCTALLHVQYCYMYGIVTCTALLHAQHCYMYGIVTCTALLHVWHCYIHVHLYVMCMCFSSAKEFLHSQFLMCLVSYVLPKAADMVVMHRYLISYGILIMFVYFGKLPSHFMALTCFWQHIWYRHIMNVMIL